MATLAKTTTYAPDLYRSLNGILLLYKTPRYTSLEMVEELRFRLSESLNNYEPRPMSKRLIIKGQLDEEKSIVEVPNLADHPLVVGPRYLPWEMQTQIIKPLSYRSSGLSVILLGGAKKLFGTKMNRAKLVSVYHITGRFGYVTDTYHYDGKIQDKSTYKHIRTGKLDAALTRIEAVQSERLFDSAAVPLDSQEAYELAKAWPSRPPKMATWPVIYRLRCIHFKLPEFKIEVTVINENEKFLAQLIHDIGLMLKSGAYAESIRRVKLGPFSVDDSLTVKDLHLQTVINHLSKYNSRHKEIFQILHQHKIAMPIRTT